MDAERLNVLDLFAGAGGFSLGFDWAGYATSVAVDLDPTAVETLKGNFEHKGTRAFHLDLSKVSANSFETFLKRQGIETNFDVIVGGPPCQGWSMVGRGKIRALAEATGRPCTKSDPRNSLFKRFVEYMRHFQPLGAVMENVPGMLSHHGINIAEEVVSLMDHAGYNVVWKKINAFDFGVPQVRERLFFVALRKDLGREFVFPETIGSSGDRVFAARSVRDAISDLPVVREGATEWIRPYQTKKNISEFAKKMRNGALEDVIFDHVCRSHRALDVEAFALLRQGGWYRDLPKRFKRYRDDIFEDKYKKLAWDKPSGCVTAHLSKDCYTHIHPSQARTITIREAARLQSFPDSFYFAGAMGSKFRLIGNAVAPLVAEKIAIQLKAFLLPIKRAGKKSRNKQQRIGEVNA